MTIKQKLSLFHKKITHKLLIYLIVTSLVPIVTLVSFLKVSIEKQLLEYRSKEIKQYEEQFNYNLSKYQDYFTLIALDYASWEDTYYSTLTKDVDWLRENVVEWLPQYFNFTYVGIIDNSQNVLLENLNGFYNHYNQKFMDTYTIINKANYVFVEGEAYITIIKDITSEKDSGRSPGKLVIAEKLDKQFIDDNLFIPNLYVNLYTKNSLVIEDTVLYPYINEEVIEIKAPLRFGNHLYHFVPLKSLEADIIGYGILKIPYDFYIHALQTLYNSQLFTYLLVIIFFSLSIYFMKKQFIDPINLTRNVIEQIRATGKPIPININRSDEIGELIHSFNELAVEIDQYNQELKSLSITDEITQLYNARHLSNLLDIKIQQNQPFMFVILEINFIKSYNNLFQRTQTDLVLKKIAYLIKRINNQHESPLAFRIDGSSFALVFENKFLNVATSWVEKFQKEISQMDFYGKSNVPTDLINASAGISIFPDEANSKDTLIKLTENKLHNATRFLSQRIGYYYSVFHDASTKESISTMEDAYSLAKVLLSVINAMDQYTLCHSEGVGKYALEIGEKLNLSTYDLELLRYGAILHDVGKIELGSELLNKVGKLSIEEITKIKMHPIYGVNILCSIPTLEPILPTVKYHHEWFNGTGYPDGLKEDEIPLFARIVSVADAFDSMVTNRPYRAKSKTIEEAVSELIRCSGTQFDPYIVEVFISTINN